MPGQELWIRWAVELQSLAQAGLFYGRDVFDRERYTRIREIAAEMLSHMAALPVETVTGLFCNEAGYQTPKIDTRAAVFQDGKILLVRERDGKWSLPGGWCDVTVSVGENTCKEVKEEAGVDVVPEKVIAIQDRAKHNKPDYAYAICKIFVQCTPLGGTFAENAETTAARYFAENELPELDGAKNTLTQIQMCFEAFRAENWKTLLD